MNVIFYSVLLLLLLLLLRDSGEGRDYTCCDFSFLCFFSSFVVSKNDGSRRWLTCGASVQYLS